MRFQKSCFYSACLMIALPFLSECALAGVARIAAGERHTVVLKDDGTLWTWGENLYGQLGDGTYTDRSIPVQVGTATDWIAVSAGAYFTVAIKKNGTLWTWGDNASGQLGDGTAGGSKNKPSEVGIVTDWKSVSAGECHVIAIKTNNTLWGWGCNLYNQLDGTDNDKSVPTQLTLATYQVASAGEAHTMAIKTDGTLWGWGSNYYGQIGNNNGFGGFERTPVQVGTLATWQSVSAGGSHTEAILGNVLFGWGYNAEGRIGDGTTDSRTVPVQVGGADWQIVSAGGGVDSHTAAIKTDRTLWAWGNNNNGQVGDGTTVEKHAPVKIGTGSDWKDVQAGDAHSVAIKEDGTLWTWGENRFGQLGDGTKTDRHVPMQINLPNSPSQNNGGYLPVIYNLLLNHRF